MAHRLVWLLALLAAWHARPAVAFTSVDVGGVVENEEMPTLDGPRAPVLGTARANVFVFFRPGQEHSLDTLRWLAHMETELAQRPVRFVAIVGDDAPEAEVRATVAETGVRMPVLIDRGNAFYGKLGVRLHPVIGIADDAHRLLAYQPYARINFHAVVRARIRRALGEISDAEMARVLAPPPAVESGPRVVARRYVNLARSLLRVKNYDKALEMARKGLESDPDLASAHAVAGQALAAQGHCPEALEAFAAALRLDPDDAAALEGRKACSSRQ